jgi:hypothetical protein
MTVYYPRWAATLVLPDDAQGSTASRVPVRVRSARLTLNDHNHADELSLGLDWYDAGADPRMLSGAQVLFWVGEADEAGEWEPTEDNLMFQGILTRAQRRTAEDERTVDCEFLDYTALFLRAKPFAASGVPKADMTLGDAWGCILEGFNNADEMINLFGGALEFRGNIPVGGPVISSAVAARFRNKGKVAVDPKGSAWDVWTKVVGMVGLTTYFDRDKCVVTTTDHLYSVVDPPRMILGENIASLCEERDNQFELKGVRCSSYDPETHRVIEAEWPVEGSEESKKLKGKKSGKGKGAKVKHDYQVFDVPGVSDPQVLLDVAKHAYKQWSIQTFRGTLSTHEMRVATAGGADFNLLRLRHGDSIRIDVAEDLLAVAIGTGAADRQAFFEAQGYSPDAATYMAKRVDDVAELRREFFVKEVTTEMETNEDGGEYRVEVSFLNKILPGGDIS